MVDNIDDIELPNMELPDGTFFNLYDNEKSGDRLIILGARRNFPMLILPHATQEKRKL